MMMTYILIIWVLVDGNVSKATVMGEFSTFERCEKANEIASSIASSKVQGATFEHSCVEWEK
jgi:hypothetical protein